MRGKVLVGTASWSDPGFIADWYPKDVPAGDRLSYYAEHFNFVELNSSFYGIPSQKQVERWCEQTPDNFVFDVKLHKLFSRHSTAPRDLPSDLRKDAKLTPKERIQLTPHLEKAMAKRFLREIEPFVSSDKLGALLLQLSPGFSPCTNKLSDLDNLLSLLEDYKVAIEFRNKGWVNGERIEELNDYLRGNNIALVMVDTPETEHFMAFPYVERVTSPDLAYMRCHGRNVEGYVKGRTVAERFNYEYSEEELQEIAQKVERVAEEAKETHVVYNNNASDYAIKSAKRFQEIIHQPSSFAKVSHLALT